MLVASFLFATMGLFVKLVSQDFGTVQIVFSRNILGMFIIIPSFFVIAEKNPGGKFNLLILRGLLGFSALCMYFYSISVMPLASAITFTKTSPIFTAVLAYYFLREKTSFLTWIAVIIGFIGILVILKPSTEMDLIGSITGMLSGFLAGAAYTSIRELRKYYNPRSIVLSFATAGTVAPALILILSTLLLPNQNTCKLTSFIMPHGIQWVYLLSIGGLATAAQYLMTKSYSLAKASAVGTVSYASLIFSIFLGILAGDQFPSTVTFIGISLIILSGILVSIKPK